MKTIWLSIPALLLWAGQVWAVPTLQVGVPLNDGYAVYTSIEGDEDTAFTSGNTLAVAGLYENKVENLGGWYGSGDDWTAFGLPAAFALKGAILVAAVPEAQVGSITLRIGNPAAPELSPFAGSLGAGDSYFPNKHDPLKNHVSDYFFFDLGNFASLDPIPNFADAADEPSDKKLGEIKTLFFFISGFDWVHFDVMALATDAKGTALVGNPGSHDATWKYEEDGGGGGEGNPVPEPGTIILVGAGLVGLALLRRKQGR